MSELAVTEQELRDLFVDRLEILTPAAFAEVSEAARRLRIPIDRAISERARLPRGFLHEQLAELWNIGFTELRISEIKLDALKRMRPDVAQKRMVAAFDWTDGLLRVAAVNPRDPALLGDLRQMTSLKIELEPVVLSGPDVGFRVEGYERGKPVGTLVVRLNGRWVEPRPLMQPVPLGSR